MHICMGVSLLAGDWHVQLEVLNRKLSLIPLKYNLASLAGE